jgi:hypothetical protein
MGDRRGSQLRVQDIGDVIERLGRTARQSPDRARGLRRDPSRLLWSCGCRAEIADEPAAMWWPCSFHTALADELLMREATKLSSS